MKPKVGILGKGKVGSAVKGGLERAGYEVRTVGKDPKGVADTAGWAEMIVLAIPFAAVDEIVREAGAGVDGKTVVDVTNVYTPEDLAALGTKSGAEELQKKIPRAKVVKALNMQFAKNMDTGHIGDQQLTFLAAGDDKEAKSTTLQMGRDLGFDAVDAGPLSNAKLLESLGLLVIRLGFGLGLGVDIGFKLVRARPQTWRGSPVVNVPLGTFTASVSNLGSPVQVNGDATRQSVVSASVVFSTVSLGLVAALVAPVVVVSGVILYRRRKS